MMSFGENILSKSNPTELRNLIMNWENEVLDLLAGRSLDSGIPSAINLEIQEKYSDVKLDYLLSHTNQRAALAVLLAKIPILDTNEVIRTLENVLHLLKLPTIEWIWWVDDYTVTKGEYRIQIDFKEHARNLLIVAKEVISQEVLSHIDIDDEVLIQLVNGLKSKLSNLKNNKVSQAGYKKLNLNNGLRPKLGFNEIEDQRYKWKTENIDSISLFKLLLENLEGSKVKDYWWIISPTILNILDDYEGPIKLKGVELLSILLFKVDDDYLKLTGMFDIFYDAVAPLLTYLPKLTPTKQSVMIQKQTYPVLIQMFSKTPDFKDRLIKLLNTGIYQSISNVRDNFEILPILTDHMIRIVECLGITTVKCLPRLLYTLGMIIADPFIYLHQTLFSKALQCLIVTILNGWPRIENHKYDILGMIVLGFKKDEKSEDVEEKLKVLVALLRKVCDEEKLENDVKELVTNDSTLKGLFNKI
ncbi:unnamed protein product [Wickerhamomyces anomalus]